MSASWPELSELLLRAVPDASVNMLHDEADSATSLALELRPKARTFDALPALPAKWTVIVFEVRSGMLSVAVVKMDRPVLDQREFDSSQMMELAEYVKSHPFLNSKWYVCYGIRNGGALQEQNSIDHLGGKSIMRSTKCELLVAGKENHPGNECKSCASVDIDMMENVDAASVWLEDFDHFVKAEVKEEPDLTNGDVKDHGGDAKVKTTTRAKLAKSSTFHPGKVAVPETMSSKVSGNKILQVNCSALQLYAIQICAHLATSSNEAKSVAVKIRLLLHV